jgi:hypothetical protein
MTRRLVRFLALFVLGVQALPAGLPLLCPEVRAALPADCQEQMAVEHRGPSLNVAAGATDCAASAFCSTPVTAVPAINHAGVVSAPETRRIPVGVAALTPTDPSAPLPPPPQA